MPTATHAETLLAYARRAPVIPFVTIEDARHAIPLARALVEAGLPVVEVTLRTAAALDAIAAIAKAVPEAIVAAGTVMQVAQIREVAELPGRSSSSHPGRPRVSPMHSRPGRFPPCRAVPRRRKPWRSASAASRW